MYLNHFGLNEPPFRITPHTEFFFGGANRGATLEALLYAITHDEGIIKVSGEVGSGKTMLCRVLMERMPRHVQTILLANPALSRDEIFYAIAEELDIRPQSERLSQLLGALQKRLITLYGDKQRVVLLIDEANAMPQETLEQVRLLSNLESSSAKLLQIVLFGQPELDEHLSQPQMRQLKERITQSFRLDPMVRSDIDAYLDFRMRAAGYRGPSVFSAAAVRRIAEASEGLTRRVNILADKSLLAAFADNVHGITARHVERAIRDSEFYRAPMSKARLGLAAGGVVAGLALGLGLPYLRSQPTPAPVAPQALAAKTAPISATPVQPAALAAPVPAQPAIAPAAATLAPTATATATATPASAAVATTPTIVATATTPAAIPTTPPSTATPSAPQTSAAADAPKATATNVAAIDTTPIVPLTGTATAPAAATGAVEPDRSAHAKPGSKNHVPPTPAGGKLTRARFAATQDWLKDAPGDQYSIQLLTVGLRDLHRIDELLARAPGRNLKLADFYVYGVRINDRQHYRLAYGLYPGLAEVTQAIKALPPVYRQFGPYQRSVERMRSQNRQ